MMCSSLNSCRPAPETLCLHSMALDAISQWRGPVSSLGQRTDVQGYRPLPERQFILFPYDLSGDAIRLIPIEEIARRFPKAAST